MKEPEKKKPIFRGNDQANFIDKRILYPYDDNHVSHYTLYSDEQPSFVESKLISALNSEDVGFDQSKTHFKVKFVLIDDDDEETQA